MHNVCPKKPRARWAMRATNQALKPWKNGLVPKGIPMLRWQQLYLRFTVILHVIWSLHMIYRQRRESKESRHFISRNRCYACLLHLVGRLSWLFEYVLKCCDVTPCWGDSCTLAPRSERQSNCRAKGIMRSLIISNPSSLSLLDHWAGLRSLPEKRVEFARIPDLQPGKIWCKSLDCISNCEFGQYW